MPVKYYIICTGQTDSEDEREEEPVIEHQENDQENDDETVDVPETVGVDEMIIETDIPRDYLRLKKRKVPK